MINKRCNLKCSHCAVFDNAFTDQYRGVNSVRDIEKVMAFLDDHRISSVIVSGGEPTLSPWLPTIVSSLHRSDRSFSVSTNATRLTGRVLRDLIRKGLTKATVSLDGGIPATHDSLRGTGTFEQAIAGLRLLSNSGVKVTIGVFLRPEITQELSQLARLCSEIGVTSISLLAPVAQGRCRNGAANLLVPAVTDQDLFDEIHLGGHAIDVSIMRPECQSESCPSGAEIFGAIGASVFDHCVYKGFETSRALLEYAVPV